MLPLDVQKLEELPTPVLTPIPSPSKKRKPKWEKALPEKFTIETTEGTLNSLSLKVEIETTDTAEKKSITTLVDSGATGEFIDRQYPKSCQFNLLKLTQPIPVYNVDGSPNDAGSITEAVDEPSRALLPLTDYFAVYSTPFPLTLSRRCVRLYTHQEHLKTLLPTDQKPI